MERCPTCQQPIEKTVYSFLESLPEDYDSCQLQALSESIRPLPIMTEHDED